MSDENKVVFLAHRNDTEVKTSSQEILACGTCSNKTWLAIYEATGDGFPRLKCAACGASAGHFGWYRKDET